MRRRLGIALLVLLAVAAIAGQVIRLPYFSEGPGPTDNVIPMIRVTGHTTYPTTGKLLLTTVSVSSEQLTPFQYLQAALDPHTDIIPQSDVLSPGQTIQQANKLEQFAMDQSQLDATYIALSRVAGYPENHAPGALVEATIPGCDASGKLFPGNVITQINGEAIASRNAASKVIDATPPGKPLRFTAQAGAKDVTVSLVRKPCGPHGEDLVGVSLINNFPVQVQIASNGIGGPSAGLMFSLGIYDLLTPGSLSGGRIIAGTGEISPDGKVLPIGGVQKKVYAAKQSGAVLFLVPKQNYAEAKQAGVDITLVPVSSFDEALAALKGDTVSGTGKGS